MADAVIETTDKVVVEETDADDALLADAFASGFAGTETPTEIVPPVVEPVVTEKADPVVEPVVDPVTEDVVPEPVFAKITEEELLTLRKQASSVDELRATIKSLQDTSFGRIGGLERTIKELTSKKEKVPAKALTSEDFTEVNTEYPDLGTKLAKDLTSVLSKNPSMDPDEIEARLSEGIAKAKEELAQHQLLQRQQEAIAALEELHPDWRTVAGPKDSQTPFRQWLEKQGAVDRDRVLNSFNPATIGRAIDQFKESIKKPAAPSAEAIRKQRLAEAVPAKGGDSLPARPKEKTVEESFAEGFASV